MDLTCRDNYWDFPELKKEFIRFLIRIFGLDLSLWDKMGFWDNRYRPFSYFDSGSLVSNVCVYTMDMMVDGKRCRAAQFSAVATLPEYRRQGLSRELMRQAMDWARNRHDFFFLFADKDAFRLYKEFGFRRTDEYKPLISVSGKAARPGLVKMDMQRPDHIQKVYQLASRRAPVSDALGVFNEKLFMYWCLYGLRDHVHYIPELDILVLYRRDNGSVTVFDIVGSTLPPFDVIYPYISDPTDHTVDFLFMVDKLQLDNFEYMKIDASGAHLLGDFPLEGTHFIFPHTSQA